MRSYIIVCQVNRLRDGVLMIVLLPWQCAFMHLGAELQKEHQRFSDLSSESMTLPINKCVDTFVEEEVKQKKTLPIEEITFYFCVCFESLHRAVFWCIIYQPSTISSLSAALQDDNSGSCSEMLCSLGSFLFYGGNRKSYVQ